MRTLIVLACLACLTVAAGGAAARGTAVTCGSTVTASTTLTADLANCPGDGLVIGADDITLDLHGHRWPATGSRARRRSTSASATTAMPA